MSAQQSDWCQRQVRALLATRPRDGRVVSMRESRGGWRYWGLTGICECISDDRKYLVMTVQEDPEKHWPVGMKLLVELDHESVPCFEGT